MIRTLYNATFVLAVFPSGGQLHFQVASEHRTAGQSHHGTHCLFFHATTSHDIYGKVRHRKIALMHVNLFMGGTAFEKKFHMIEYDIGSVTFNRIFAFMGPNTKHCKNYYFLHKMFDPSIERQLAI